MPSLRFSGVANTIRAPRYRYSVGKPYNPVSALYTTLARSLSIQRSIPRQIPIIATLKTGELDINPVFEKEPTQLQPLKNPRTLVS